jgi:hypothetical protein
MLKKKGYTAIIHQLHFGSSLVAILKEQPRANNAMNICINTNMMM